MLTLNELLEIAKRYNAADYKIAGIDNSNSLCEIIIDRLEKTIAISEYDWDWGCMRDPIETIEDNKGNHYYIEVIDETNIINDTRLENYIKNNYGDDEEVCNDDDEDDNSTPYDEDEEFWRREFGFYDDEDEDDLD